MDGFHIEKLVFESLPQIHVTALALRSRRHIHKATLACSFRLVHSANGKAYYQALCQHLVKRGYSCHLLGPGRPGRA